MDYSEKESSVSHMVKVYGAFGHKYLKLEIPDTLMKTGSVLEIENHKYRLLSIVEEGGKPSAVNVVMVDQP